MGDTSSVVLQVKAWSSVSGVLEHLRREIWFANEVVPRFVYQAVRFLMFVLSLHHSNFHQSTKIHSMLNNGLSYSPMALFITPYSPSSA